MLILGLIGGIMEYLKSPDQKQKEVQELALRDSLARLQREKEEITRKVEQEKIAKRMTIKKLEAAFSIKFERGNNTPEGLENRTASLFKAVILQGIGNPDNLDNVCILLTGALKLEQNKVAYLKFLDVLYGTGAISAAQSIAGLANISEPTELPATLSIEGKTTSVLVNNIGGVPLVTITVQTKQD
jgi:hypothetical protein